MKSCLKKTLFWGLSLGLASSASAQKTADVQAIKQFCGCFEVEFNFAETFSTKTDYQTQEKHRSQAIEWVELIEETPQKLVLQHLLILGKDPEKQQVIKHWRQDWSYQNQTLFQFKGHATWQRQERSPQEVAGQWTQSVWEVDDAPRYQASGSWIHLDGKQYWESSAPTPLPRREYTKRQDYHIMHRRNRQEILDWGWVHEQDNSKQVLDDQGQISEIIAYEKGYNSYRRIDPKHCLKAQTWWAEQAPFWQEVRNIWADVLNRNPLLKLQTKIQDKPLYEHLYQTQNPQEARQIIENFVLKPQ